MEPEATPLSSTPPSSTSRSAGEVRAVRRLRSFLRWAVAGLVAATSCACAPARVRSAARELRVELQDQVPTDALLLAVAREGRIGVAVGGRGDRDPGEILRSTDGGRSWSVVGSPSTARLYDVAFTDEIAPDPEGGGAVVAVGLDGQILRSTDDGESWQVVLLGADWLAGVAFVDGRRGHVVGARGDRAVWLATADGGRTWTPGPEQATASFLRAIAFRDARFGVVVGDEGTLLVTEDGGATWRAQESGGGYLRGIEFGPDGTTWIVGGPGVLLRRTPGSVDWERLPFVAGEKLNSIRFVDEDHGWITSMEGTLWVTDDAGGSWRVLHRTANLHLVGSVAPRVDGSPRDGPGLVVGDGGTVLSVSFEE